MVKVSYDSNGDIIGFYPEDIQYASIPEPYIEIDKATHMDCINNYGLRKIDTVNKVVVTYTPPAPTGDQVKKRKIAVLEQEYEPRFKNMALAWATANLAKDTDSVTAREAEYKALQAEYEKKRGEIND